MVCSKFTDVSIKKLCWKNFLIGQKKRNIEWFYILGYLQFKWFAGVVSDVLVDGVKMITVLRWWQYYHTKYFRCSICASLIKSTRFKFIFLRDGNIEEPQFSIFFLGRRVDTEFIFVCEFPCPQKSTLGFEDGSEDHANNSCCKWRVHFLW